MSLNTFPRRCRSHARGGTFLGLIAGLIVGLAVALSVVIYVAKVPIPFVNNVPVHNSDQDAAEDQKNRNWNPNTTLQTHGPTAPASGASNPDSVASGAASGAQPGNAQQQPMAVPPPVEVAPSAPPAPGEPGASSGNVQPSAPSQSRAVTRPAAANTATSAPSNRKPTPPGDVLGDFAAARVRAADGAGGNANTAATADPFLYFVQTGAFSATQDADAERARLSLLGMEAAVSERDQAGRVVYRVRIGPFQNKAAADQIKDRLASNGFEAALVRVQR